MQYSIAVFTLVVLGLGNGLQFSEKNVISDPSRPV